MAGKSVHYINALNKVIYLLFVTKCNWFYSLVFLIAYGAPYAAIYTCSVKYGKNSPKESAQITGKIMFNLHE